MWRAAIAALTLVALPGAAIGQTQRSHPERFESWEVSCRAPGQCSLEVDGRANLEGGFFAGVLLSISDRLVAVLPENPLRITSAIIRVENRFQMNLPNCIQQSACVAADGSALLTYLPTAQNLVARLTDTTGRAIIVEFPVAGLQQAVMRMVQLNGARR